MTRGGLGLPLLAAGLLLSAALVVGLAGHVEAAVLMLSALVLMAGVGMVMYSRVGVVVLVPLLGMLWQAALTALAYAYMRVMGAPGSSYLLLGAAGFAGFMLSAAALIKMLREVPWRPGKKG